MKQEIIEKILEKYLGWEKEEGKEVISDSPSNPFVWKYVLVRGYYAWVWAGKLLDTTPWNIILEDARMLWRWRCKEWIWLSWIASHWLADREEVKILEEQKKIVITDNRVSTFFECTKEVEEQIRNYKIAEQS